MSKKAFKIRRNPPEIRENPHGFGESGFVKSEIRRIWVIRILTDLKSAGFADFHGFVNPKSADSDIRIFANLTPDLRIYGYPRVIRNTSNRHLGVHG